MMDRVFFNVSNGKDGKGGGKTTKLDHEGFLLTSNALLNVSATDGVAIYSNSSVSVKSRVGVEVGGRGGAVDIGGGVLKVANDELVAGGESVQGAK